MNEDESTTAGRTGRPSRYTADITKMRAVNEDFVHIAGSVGHAGEIWRLQKGKISLKFHIYSIEELKLMSPLIAPYT
jgi:hypothetical protein